MDAVVIGAGQAGKHLSLVLSAEKYDVTLIDADRERLEWAEESLDIRTICDQGASPQVLEIAGASEARVVAAVTDSDEVNLIAAATAHQLGTARVAARVYNQAYLGGGRIQYRNLLGIDLIIFPQSLTALEIAKLIENPAAVAVENFASGRVQMRQMVVREDSPAVGQKIRDLFPPDRSGGVLVVSLSRGDAIAVPGPDDVVEAEDRVTVIMQEGRSGSVRRLFRDVEGSAEKVVIAGGGTTAQILAQILETRNVGVTLIEGDRQRCELLSRILSRTHVVHGDATRLAVLEEERVGKGDIFVAICGSDEVNVMSALQAKAMGVPRLIVAVNRVDYVPLVEGTGVDHAVSPRILTGNRILALAGRAQIRSMAVLQGGKAEVVELRAEPGSPAANGVIGESLRLPKGSLVGALVRGEEVIVPRGGDTILPGDTVVAFALSSTIDLLGEMFCGPEETGQVLPESQ